MNSLVFISYSKINNEYRNHNEIAGLIAKTL